MTSPARATSHLWPSFLPAARGSFTRGPSGRCHDPRGRSRRPRRHGRCCTANSQAVYVASGHVLFVRGQALLAQPIDGRTLRLNDVPFAVAENVWVDPIWGSGDFSASQNGVLAYRQQPRRRPRARLARPVRSNRGNAWVPPGGGRIPTSRPTVAASWSRARTLRMRASSGSSTSSGAPPPDRARGGERAVCPVVSGRTSPLLRLTGAGRRRHLPTARGRRRGAGDKLGSRPPRQLRSTTSRPTGSRWSWTCGARTAWATCSSCPSTATEPAEAAGREPVHGGLGSLLARRAVPRLCLRRGYRRNRRCSFSRSRRPVCDGRSPPAAAVPGVALGRPRALLPRGREAHGGGRSAGLRSSFVRKAAGPLRGTAARVIPPEASTSPHRTANGSCSSRSWRAGGSSRSSSSPTGWPPAPAEPVRLHLARRSGPRVKIRPPQEERMARIGVAVVGAGFMGGVHAEALRRAGCEVRGRPRRLGRRVHEVRRGDRRAEGLPLARTSCSATRRSSPSTSPRRTSSTSRWRRRALEAGKHVLCEKPLAMTSKESAELVALARKHPKQAAGVNYNIRFYPLCLEARERVRGGRARGGPPRRRQLRPGLAAPTTPTTTGASWPTRAASCGPWPTSAPTGWTWSTSITGLEVEAVCADLLDRPPGPPPAEGRGRDLQRQARQGGRPSPSTSPPRTTAAILLRFKGGARGTLVVSQVTAGRKNCLRYEIAAEKGALAWNSECPEELWIGRRGGPNELLMRDPSILLGPARAAVGVPGRPRRGLPDTFKQCFRAFYDYIAAGRLLGPAALPHASPTATARSSLCEASPARATAKGRLGEGPRRTKCHETRIRLRDPARPLARRGARASPPPRASSASS